MSAVLGLLFLLQLTPPGSLQPSVSRLLPAQLASFEFRHIPAQVYACESFPIVIEAKDQYGAHYNYPGTGDLKTSLDTTYTYIAPNRVQFQNGNCSTNVVITLAESLLIRCTDASGGVTSLSPIIEVLPGMPRQFLVVLPGESLVPGSPTGRSRLPINQIAGNGMTFTAYITDAGFNIIRFRDDTISFSSTDQFAQLPSGARLSDGSAIIPGTMRTAGVQRLTVSPVGSSPVEPGISSPFGVSPGSFQELLLLLPGESPRPGDTTTAAWATPGKTGTATPQYLRDPFLVTVYPCDRCWNPVHGPDDSVTLASDFSVEFTPAGALLMDSAMFTIQFNDPGQNQNVWVVDNTLRRTSYVSHVDIRPRGSQLEIIAPQTVRAGETAYIEVTVRDLNLKPVVATVLNVSVVEGRGVILGDPHGLLTDTIGYAQARFLCTQAHAPDSNSVRIQSGTADTVIKIFVNHLSDSLFAFPNPFGFNRDVAQISYYLPNSSDVTVTIYDPFGNQVRTMYFRERTNGAMAGDNTIYWNGRNAQGRRVASGIYTIQVVGQRHTGIGFKSAYRIGVIW